jgi:hypothetical protein
VERAVDMFTVEKFVSGDVICKCGDPVSRVIVMRSGNAIMWNHPRPIELLKLKQVSESAMFKKSNDRKRNSLQLSPHAEGESSMNESSIQVEQNMKKMLSEYKVKVGLKTYYPLTYTSIY